jgi:PKD repeat protein
VLLLAGPAPASAQGWWDLNWPCRRSVTVPAFTPEKLPGHDVVVLTMPTAGQAADDCEDLRVVTPGGAEVPCRVLMVGPGDQVRIAFSPPGARDRRYYVYFGNRSAGPPKETPELRRGVLLETWRYPGGPIANLDDVQKTYDKAASQPRNFLGRDFRPSVFLGHNPFGPQNQLASRFTAWLEVRTPGVHVFACASQDASFLLVDDKVVVANGGHHPPHGDIRSRGSVTLDKGLHKLTLYHICTTGDPVVMAAWQQPGEKRIWTIPAEAFARVITAEPGPMERYGKSEGFDFLPKYGGESFVENRYYQRWSFEALAVGQPARIADFVWDFGDGQKSGRPSPEHVYLLPGEYTVTLTAKGVRGELKQSNRIFVTRPWDQVAENRLDPPIRHVQIVREYDFAALSPEATAHAILLLSRAGAGEPVKQAAMALVSGNKAAPADLMAEVMPLAEAALDPAAAARAYVKAAEMTPGPAFKARFLVRAGQITLDRLRDANEAMKLHERTIRAYGASTTDEAIRMARIGIGDVWRFRAQLEDARRTYAAAGLGADINPARLAIAKGNFARRVEDYVRKGRLDDAQESIDLWAAAIPLDKLDGYWSLLAVRKHLASGSPERAAREARTLVAVNPQSQYAPELLLLASEAYIKLTMPDESKAALRQIAEKYPESPLAAKARNVLSE